MEYWFRAEEVRAAVFMVEARNEEEAYEFASEVVCEDEIDWDVKQEDLERI